MDSARTGQTPSSSIKIDGLCRAVPGTRASAQPVPLPLTVLLLLLFWAGSIHPSDISSDVPSSRKLSLITGRAATSSGLPIPGLIPLGHYCLTYRSFIPFPHSSNGP